MIQDRKECFLCGRWTGLEVHHIFNGPWRKIAEEDGLTCYLCRDCHRRVHEEAEVRLRLKEVGQFIYEQSHTREEFVRRYGKNYDISEGVEDHLSGEELEQAEDQDHPMAASIDDRGGTGDPHAEGEEDAVSDYWTKSSRLPRDIYNRVLWLVRGYDRTKDELDSLITMDGSHGEGRGQGPSDPTVQAAIRRERLLDDFRAVEDARLMIPEEYRDVVFKNVKDTRPFKTFPEFDYAHEQTWKNQRRKFLREVARNKGWWW